MAGHEGHDMNNMDHDMGGHEGHDMNNMDHDMAGHDGHDMEGEGCHAMDMPSLPGWQQAAWIIGTFVLLGAAVWITTLFAPITF